MIEKNDIENFAIGFGLYYLMVYAFLFYPAVVMIEQFGNLEEGGGLIFGFLAGAITVVTILFLAHMVKETGKPGYKAILVGIYLYFLYPFWQYVSWMWGDTFYSDDGFPGFDWNPFSLIGVLISFVAPAFMIFFYFLLLPIYPVVVFSIQAGVSMGWFMGVLSFLFWGVIFALSIGFLWDKDTPFKLKLGIFALLASLYIYTSFQGIQLIEHFTCLE